MKLQRENEIVISENSLRESEEPDIWFCEEIIFS